MALQRRSMSFLFPLVWSLEAVVSAHQSLSLTCASADCTACASLAALRDHRALNMGSGSSEYDVAISSASSTCTCNTQRRQP